eukprot:5006862-Amphidinium_carterae.1
MFFNAPCRLVFRTVGDSTPAGNGLRHPGYEQAHQLTRLVGARKSCCQLYRYCSGELVDGRTGSAALNSCSPPFVCHFLSCLPRVCFIY